MRNYLNNIDYFLSNGSRCVCTVCNGSVFEANSYVSLCFLLQKIDKIRAITCSLEMRERSLALF